MPKAMPDTTHKPAALKASLNCSAVCEPCGVGLRLPTTDTAWPYTITGAPRVIKGKVLMRKCDHQGENQGERHETP